MAQWTEGHGDSDSRTTISDGTITYHTDEIFPGDTAREAVEDFLRDYDCGDLTGEFAVEIRCLEGKPINGGEMWVAEFADGRFVSCRIHRRGEQVRYGEGTLC